jgi:hypothetical protein
LSLPLFRHSLAALDSAEKKTVSNAKALFAPCKVYKPKSWERLLGLYRAVWCMQAASDVHGADHPMN